MAVFRWQGVSPRGEVLAGEMEAPTRDAVLVRLRSQRIQPIPAKIKEKGRGLDRELTIPGFGESIKQRDVVIFTRQLATMIDAGLPIVQCLDVLATQSPNKKLRGVVRQLKDEVEAGSTFTDALRKHPKLFDDLFVNMVAAGEVGGILDSILHRLAGYMEKAMKLKSKIKGAMIYPATIVTVAVGVTAILLIFVIPVFAELFGSFGQALPAPTQFVINLSNFTIAYFHYMFGVLIAVGIASRQFYRTEAGRLTFDQMFLQLPVFGDLIRKSAVARFTRTLSTLVSSGVPILDALAITARTAGNKVVERAVLATRVSISEGRTIAEPLAQSKVFPPMVCQMISVGETTGALDAMLQKIADFYEEEVDNAVANLTALMEPLVILFLGVVIGGLVISMYLPIFKLGSVIG
ncbi:MAG TPA: type II secretion system F family protein [Candidatus Margulisiibacteriota bacterium]|nr:type II secretion system F family protein [Candidatus Margulisiibacteriota bacterium]